LVCNHHGDVLHIHMDCVGEEHQLNEGDQQNQGQGPAVADHQNEFLLRDRPDPFQHSGFLREGFLVVMVDSIMRVNSFDQDCDHGFGQ
jgi:hypothetical protein